MRRDGRQLPEATHRTDVLDGRFFPSSLGILAHQIDRLPLGGNQHLALLKRPCEVEKVGVLDDQRQIDTGIAEAGLKTLGPLLYLRPGDESPLAGWERGRAGHPRLPMSSR
jgi:hypothetical protein